MIKYEISSFLKYVPLIGALAFLTTSCAEPDLLIERWPSEVASINSGNESSTVTVIDPVVEPPLIYIVLEGGGMHMHPAIEVIRRIEVASKKPISKLVDGIIGLSSGAVAAAHLCAPNFSGEAVRTAEDLKNEFSSLLVSNASGPAARGNFRKTIGEASLKEALTHLMIVSYNITEDIVEVFDSTEERHINIPIWNAAQASISGLIPGLGAATIEYGDGISSSGWVDAGLAKHHDPLYKILAMNLKKKFPNRQILIYSFGNGYSTLNGLKDHSLAVRYKKYKDTNINLYRFQPDYHDISHWLWSKEHEWTLMLMSPTSSNINAIQDHFFPYVEDNIYYKDMMYLFSGDR